MRVSIPLHSKNKLDIIQYQDMNFEFDITNELVCDYWMLIFSLAQISSFFIQFSLKLFELSEFLEEHDYPKFQILKYSQFTNYNLQLKYTDIINLNKYLNYILTFLSFVFNSSLIIHTIIFIYICIKNLKQNDKMLILLILSILRMGNGDIIAEADFLKQYQQTNYYFWNNYVGIVLNLSQVVNYYNYTNFQGYILNSNINGNWNNNFRVNLRMPNGWYYDCTAAGVSSTNSTVCKRALKSNTTFFAQLGRLVYNTFSQPYWAFGINNQKLTFTNSTLRNSLYNLVMKIWAAVGYNDFEIQMMYEGDKAIANFMRAGATYTYDNFISQSYYYQYIVYGLYFRAPGVSQSADPTWYTNMAAYFDNVIYGIYTFQPVIFTDPTLATISNLLSQNYTYGYFQRRFKVNSTFSQSSFSHTVALSRVRLVQGNGTDGITNTFAAAVWWIDFIMESLAYQLTDVSIDGSANLYNFQSVFGHAPSFAPTALYYGSIMAILAGELNPRIIIPSLYEGTSSRIKIWGLSSATKYKFLIINKDTNTSLDGYVNLQVKSKEGQAMTCIYMKAPNLTSKAQHITIGGHYYIGGNSTIQGNNSYHQYYYNSDIKGFQISIKYAQVAICQASNSQLLIPTAQSYSYEVMSKYMVYLAIAFILFVI